LPNLQKWVMLNWECATWSTGNRFYFPAAYRSRSWA